MVTTRNQIVDSGESKVSQKGREQLSSAPVRVRRETKSKLEHLLRRANKDRLGRRVKPDDLIGFALGLITDDHLTTICDGTLSNKVAPLSAFVVDGTNLGEPSYEYQTVVKRQAELHRIGS